MNNEVKKVLFIVNRFSGGGFRPEVEERILRACESQHVECTIEFTQSRGHATTLARNGVEKGFSLVVAVGGDGTLNETAQGLIGSSIPMGIIPKGSGNGLARHLGIPVSVPSALTTLFRSKPVVIDTFLINGKLSLNVSGIGFDGHIANLFGTQVKRGLAGYVKLSVNEFFRFKEFRLKLKLNRGNEVLTRKGFVMAIANSSQYGNNARIAPAASVCDGKLHLSILKKVPPYRIDFIYSFFKGNVNQSRYCETLEADNFSLTTDFPIAYHIDGEPSGFTDTFNVQIQPSSLHVMVPEGKNI